MYVLAVSECVGSEESIRCPLSLYSFEALSLLEPEACVSWLGWKQADFGNLLSLLYLKPGLQACVGGILGGS